jgi:hypothetical protein
MIGVIEGLGIFFDRRVFKLSFKNIIELHNASEVEFVSSEAIECRLASSIFVASNWEPFE